MNEKITLALECNDVLDQCIREIYRGAIDKNDALLIIAGQLLETVAKIRTTLSQLERI